MVVGRRVERKLELVVPVKDATHSWPTVTYVYSTVQSSSMDERVYFCRE